MKKLITVLLILTLIFAFVACGKSDEVPTTTLPYVDSGVNNNYNNEYVDNSYIDTTYSNSDVITNVAPQPTETQVVQNTTQSSSGSGSNSTPTTTAENVTVAPTTSAPKGLTPDSVESNGGVEKATYNISERTYIVYYPTELLNSKSQMDGTIVELINGIEVIRICDSLEFETNRFDNKSEFLRAKDIEVAKCTK